jgi:hypothetical protein
MGRGAGGRWEREEGEKGRESMTCGPHQLVVGIEDKYRVWMSTKKLYILW